jgi:putative FmdB family regulatory protein
MLTLTSVPTYTYTCTACNDVVEKRQSFSDPPLTTCDQCGGSLRKVIHPVGIVFKGSGWYINDSRSSTSSANSPAPSSTTPSTDSKDSKDTKTAEPAAKAESAKTETTA